MSFLVLHHLDPCQKVGKSLVTQYEPRWEGKYKHHPAFISPDDFQRKHPGPAALQRNPVAPAESGPQSAQE